MGFEEGLRLRLRRRGGRPTRTRRAGPEQGAFGRGGAHIQTPTPQNQRVRYPMK